MIDNNERETIVNDWKRSGEYSCRVQHRISDNSVAGYRRRDWSVFERPHRGVTEPRAILADKDNGLTSRGVVWPLLVFVSPPPPLDREALSSSIGNPARRFGNAPRTMPFFPSSNFLLILTLARVNTRNYLPYVTTWRIKECQDLFYSRLHCYYAHRVARVRFELENTPSCNAIFIHFYYFCCHAVRFPLSPLSSDFSSLEKAIFSLAISLKNPEKRRKKKYLKSGVKNVSLHEWKRDLFLFHLGVAWNMKGDLKVAKNNFAEIYTGLLLKGSFVKVHLLPNNPDENS